MNIIWKPRKSTRRKRHRSLFSFLSLRFRILPSLLVLLLLTLVFSGIYFFPKDRIVFKNTTYSGLRNLNRQDIDTALAKYSGESLLNIPPQDIEEHLTQTFSEIKFLRIEKIYPNTIHIHIEEKLPKLLYINFNGSYVFDKDTDILAVSRNNDPTNFPEQDYNLARGFGNPDASYIEDRIAGNLQDEALEQFNFDDVEFTQKEKTLQVLVSEIQTKFKNKLQKQQELTNFEEFSNIPTILGWDDTIYEEKNDFEKTYIQFFSTLITSLEEKYGLQDTQNVWDGNYTTNIRIDSNTLLKFSMQRDLELQLEDLEIILESKSKNLSAINYIDLSSNKVIVSWD